VQSAAFGADSITVENIFALLEDLQAPGIQINNRVVNHFSDSVVISYPMEAEVGVILILFNILFRCATVLRRGYCSGERLYAVNSVIMIHKHLALHW
jgi:hypothetical protein